MPQIKKTFTKGETRGAVKSGNFLGNAYVVTQPLASSLKNKMRNDENVKLQNQRHSAFTDAQRQNCKSATSIN